MLFWLRHSSFVLIDSFIFAVSQPKLKRICQDDSIKNNHEDVQKSQTYQQFVRNMDNEIKQLQDSEHFYNTGESTTSLPGYFFVFVFGFGVCFWHRNVNNFFIIFILFSDDVDYHNDCISKKTLIQLSSDVAKLKAKGAVDALNKNKLTLLINFAMRNVDVVKNLSAGPVSIRILCWYSFSFLEHFRQINFVFFSIFRILKMIMKSKLTKFWMQLKLVCWFAICTQRQKT